MEFRKALENKPSPMTRLPFHSLPLNPCVVGGQNTLRNSRLRTSWTAWTPEWRFNAGPEHWAPRSFAKRKKSRASNPLRSNSDFRSLTYYIAYYGTKWPCTPGTTATRYSLRRTYWAIMGFGHSQPPEKAYFTQKLD